MHAPARNPDFCGATGVGSWIENLDDAALLTLFRKDSRCSQKLHVTSEAQSTSLDNMKKAH